METIYLLADYLFLIGCSAILFMVLLSIFSIVLAFLLKNTAYVTLNNGEVKFTEEQLLLGVHKRVGNLKLHPAFIVLAVVCALATVVLVNKFYNDSEIIKLDYNVLVEKIKEDNSPQVRQLFKISYADNKITELENRKILRMIRQNKINQDNQIKAVEQAQLRDDLERLKQGQIDSKDQS